MVNSRMVWQILLVLIVSFTAGYFTVGAGQGILGDWSGDEGSYLSMAWASKDNPCTGEKPDNYSEECIRCNNDTGDYEVKEKCRLEKCGDWAVQKAPNLVPATASNPAEFQFAIKKQNEVDTKKKEESYSRGQAEASKTEQFTFNVDCGGTEPVKIKPKVTLDVVALQNIKPKKRQVISARKEQSFNLEPKTKPSGFGESVVWKWNGQTPTFKETLKPKQAGTGRIKGRLQGGGLKGKPKKGPKGIAVKMKFPEDHQPDVTTAGKDDDDSIRYKLLPKDAKGIKGTVKIKLVGTEGHDKIYELKEKKPGEHSVGFKWDEDKLTEDSKYTHVRGSWVLEDVTSYAKTVELAPGFKYFGFWTHSTYTYPKEENCEEQNTDTIVFEGSNQCGDRSHEHLPSDFVEATGMQGSGESINFGTLGWDESCYTQVDDPDEVDEDKNWDIQVDWTDTQLVNRQVKIDEPKGACSGFDSIGDNTVAAPASGGNIENNSNWSCGDNIYVPYLDEGSREKTVKDTCPICGSDEKEDTIDHFDPSENSCPDDEDDINNISNTHDNAPLLKLYKEKESS